MLELTGLCKRYGAASAAVDRVSLAVKPGEFFSLLGPSGCGKTTLLRLVAGFERADAGSIKLAGKEVTALPPHQRACNLVFQRYALFPHLDVGQNVAFGPRVAGLGKAAIGERVAEALALVALTGFERRAVETLSGGQQQRVAIARALVNRPKVLLLDEPLSALDLKLRQRMQVELLALQRRLATTFVYVTHAQDEALALSDRIAVMNGGKVEQLGTPQEVYERPATPFVATFIGQMNRLPGVVREVGDVATVEVNGRLLRGKVGERQRGDVRAGASATLLVRPERLHLVTGGTPAEANTVVAQVAQVLFKGSTAELHASCGTGGADLVASLPLGGGLPAPGAAVTLSFASEAAIIMPGEVPP